MGAKEKNGKKLKAIDYEEIIVKAINSKEVRVNRKKFLTDTLGKKYPEQIEEMIHTSPAQCQIGSREISSVADKAVFLESSFSVSTSGLLGLAGGIASVAAISADILQFLVVSIRNMQKLAYLYGWPELTSDVEISEEQRDYILLLLGVMFDVKESVTILSKAAIPVGKSIVMKKIVPKNIMSKIQEKLVAKMVQGVAKMIPIVGGVLSASFTAASFATMNSRLKRFLVDAKEADPFYFRICTPGAAAVRFDIVIANLNLLEKNERNQFLLNLKGAGKQALIYESFCGKYRELMKRLEEYRPSVYGYICKGALVLDYYHFMEAELESDITDSALYQYCENTKQLREKREKCFDEDAAEILKWHHILLRNYCLIAENSKRTKENWAKIYSLRSLWERDKAAKSFPKLFQKDISKMRYNELRQMYIFILCTLLEVMHKKERG